MKFLYVFYIKSFYKIIAIHQRNNSVLTLLQPINNISKEKQLYENELFNYLGEKTNTNTLPKNNGGDAHKNSKQLKRCSYLRKKPASQVNDKVLNPSL